MATAVTPVSQQVAWTVQDPANDYFDQSGALSDPETYAHTDTFSDW